MRGRRLAKDVLAAAARLDRAEPRGATLLIYHRIGGGTADELDTSAEVFATQVDVLTNGGIDVVGLDDALDRLDAGDGRPTVVITFDDGFADVYHNAFPLLRARELPFTLYLTAGLVGGRMAWEGSTAKRPDGAALTWEQVAEMHASGLCTLGNHTYTHAGPDAVDVGQLDSCSDAIEHRLGVRPMHFAWTWGIAVPSLLPAVRSRFRSAATGRVGRNPPGHDRHELLRIPVRSSDPPGFFRSKLEGRLWAERSYGALVRGAKASKRLVRRG